MPASSSVKNAHPAAPLIPPALGTFLARMALAGFVVWILALTGHA